MGLCFCVVIACPTKTDVVRFSILGGLELRIESNALKSSDFHPKTVQDSEFLMQSLTASEDADMIQSKETCIPMSHATNLGPRPKTTSGVLVETRERCICTPRKAPGGRNAPLWGPVNSPGLCRSGVGFPHRGPHKTAPWGSRDFPVFRCINLDVGGTGS